MCLLQVALWIAGVAILLSLQQVGWYGNKELAALRANCDYEERLSMCQAVRGCATITAQTMAELQIAVDAGKVSLLEECEIASASQEAQRICLSLVHKHSSACKGAQEGNNGEEHKTGMDNDAAASGSPAVRHIEFRSGNPADSGLLNSASVTMQTMRDACARTSCG